MEKVAGKLFHSQPFSLALLASRCTAFFPVSVGTEVSELAAILLPAVTQPPRRSQ